MAGITVIEGGAHNLVLEGDVDIAGTLTTIGMEVPAGGGSLNGCSGPLSAGTGGNKLIFGGENYQTVLFSTDEGEIDRTLNVPALSVDKSGGAVEFRTGAGRRERNVS